MKILAPGIILFVLLNLLVISVKSQDTIILNTKEKLISIVTEISDSDVRFKEFSNPAGPDFIIKKSAVDYIIFKNGEQKQFKKEKRIVPYGRNIFSYHLFDIVYQDFAISYEYILKSGRVGFKIPLALGFNTNNDNNGPYQYKNLAYTGLGVNVYVTGQHIASYFMGPEIHFGLGKDFLYSYDYYYENSSESEFFYGRLLINNGITVSPVPNLRLSSVLGIGVRYYDLPESDDDGVQSTAYFTFTMGYRF
jgi:hypothetical protein